MTRITDNHNDGHQISEIVVNLLRDIHHQDPEAFAELVSWRTSVNAKLASHPVIPITTSNRGKTQVTLIGLLNGILIAAHAQKVAAVVDNDVVVGFTLMERVEDFIKLQESTGIPAVAGRSV